MVYRIFFILLTVTTFLSSEASHVVGGELYYTRVANNSYEVVFKIYFDCQNATDGVINRDGRKANFALFNARTNKLIRSLELRSIANTETEVNSVNYECVKKPSGTCVIEYVFRQTIDIDPGEDGVIIAHQLCCRNSIIDNVSSAGETGSTNWVYIPPSTMVNSSPRFNELPPTYICVNAPLTVDYSATDPDGDSLVYEFFTPFHGGSDTDPKPTVISSPPYNLINWGTGYSLNNQVPGLPSGFINKATGEYTITPNSKGIFTIGVKVTEYRNGVAIGSVFRDYQFSVIDCEFDVLSNFKVPNGTTVGGSYTFECGDSVIFNNTSQVRPGLISKYFWDFGDPTTTSDTVTTFDKSSVFYIYPGNGDYTVTLVVTSSICTSTYKYNVRIRSTKNFTLGPDKIFCEKVQYILNTNATDAVSVNWNTEETGSFITARDTGTYIANVSYGRCLYSDTVHLSFDNVPPSKLPDDTLICDSLFTATLDVGQPNLIYQWKTPQTVRTQSIEVSKSGLYTVAMSNTNCTIYDTIRVWQATQPRIRDTLFCNEFNHTISLGDIEEATYLWSNGSSSNSATFSEGGTHWVNVAQRHCVKYDTFIVDNSEVSIDLGEDRHFCDSMNVRLDGGSSGVVFEWSTAESSRIINVNKPGIYSVNVTNAEGCEQSDSVIFTLTSSPIIDIGEDTTICINSPTTIDAPSGFEKYEWNTGETGKSITTILEGTYKVKVTDGFKCTDEDSLYITVDPTVLPDVLFIPTAFTPNNDNTNEWFPYSDEVIQPAFWVKVYSRWGEKVFDSQEQGTTKWNGYYKGKIVPTGIYIYSVSYRGCDGNTKTDKGTVHALY